MTATQAPPEIIIGPNSEPQQAFLESDADITIYGGAAGGGKTYGMLLDPIQHLDVKGFKAVFFRRTNDETDKPGGLWDESLGLYSLLKGRSNKNKLRWIFPARSRIDFDHIQYESTLQNWRSSQIAAMYFDQLETFTEHMFFYMFSRNRSVSGVKPYIKATVNPDPDSWVRTFLSWWIDEETGFPIKERDRKMRWFVRDGDYMIWADTKEELLEIEGVSEDDPTSVVFIKADVFDNVTLLQSNPKYLGSLKAMGYVDRARLLGGNWNVRHTAGNVMRKQMFRVIYAWPSMVTEARAWDLAATKQEGSNDPDWTTGTRVGMDEHNRIFILDQVRLRDTSLKVELAIKYTAEKDGFNLPIGIEQEGGASGKGWPESIIRQHLQGHIANYFPPEADKVSRAKVLAAQAEIGNVYLFNANGPGSYCAWIEEFLNEAENFPPKKKGGHDDRIDSAVLGYEMCLNGYGALGWPVEANQNKNRVAGQDVPEGVFGFHTESESDSFRRGMEDFHGPGQYDRFNPDGMS